MILVRVEEDCQADTVITMTMIIIRKRDWMVVVGIIKKMVVAIKHESMR